MKRSHKLADFLVYGNFIISTGAALLIWQTYLLLYLKPDFFMVLFGFASTLFIYNLDRLVVLKSIAGLKSDRHVWITENARIMITISALCLLFVGVSAFYLPWKAILFLGHLGVISVLYSIPLFTKNKDKSSLRNIKGLKIFLITYVWMATTVLLPVIAYPPTPGAHISLRDGIVWLMCLKRALFIFAITIPFDIRDYKSDLRSGVHTIPNMIGIPAARMLSVLCLALLSGLAFFHYGLLHPFSWAIFISAISTMYFVYKAEETHHEYYFTGLLDGTIIIQFILVFIASKML